MKPKFIIEARPLKYNSDRLNQIFTAIDEKDLDLSLEILNDHYYNVINIFRRNTKGHFILYDRKETKMDECYKCGFNDVDYGCKCDNFNKWYACPIENKKPENIQALKEYVKQKEISMSIIRTLSVKFSELAKELRNEVKDDYGVEIEFRLSSKNDGNDLSTYVKVIVTKNERDISLLNVYIDLDAPLSETLLYIKNRFNTTRALEFYRKE